MEDQIYRNLPKGYNPNITINERREKTYNPPPISSQRANADYYSIKKELDVYQMLKINKKMTKNIQYFTYKNKIYKFDELPWETMYKTPEEKLITEEKLFSSTQKSFLDQHKHRIKSEGQTPISASYFRSRRREGSDGTTQKEIQNLFLYHQKILKILLYYFILKLNTLVRTSGYDLPQHAWTNYFVNDYQVIKIKYHQSLNLYNYILMVEVYRHNKHNGFTFYLEIYFRPENMTIWIGKSHLVGIQSQDNLVFKDLDYPIKSVKNNKKLSGIPIQDTDKQILNQKYQELEDYETREKEIKSRSYNAFERDINYNKGHKCFKPNGELLIDAKTSNDCLSFNPKIKQVGVWDRECSTDSECPFYKANKNYPNQFGGCIEGKCQLPLGMKRIGFKHYTKDKPICYNCHKKENILTSDGYYKIVDRQCSGIECNMCCDHQKDKTLYQKQVSPDYAFENDQTVREKHNDILNKMGLGVNKFIIDVPQKDVTNDESLV